MPQKSHRNKWTLVPNVRTPQSWPYNSRTVIAIASRHWHEFTQQKGDGSHNPIFKCTKLIQSTHIAKNNLALIVPRKSSPSSSPGDVSRKPGPCEEYMVVRHRDVKWIMLDSLLYKGMGNHGNLQVGLVWNCVRLVSHLVAKIFLWKWN